MTRAHPSLALALLALLVVGCGRGGGDDELMRRVAQAEAAATKAEAAQQRAELAAAKAISEAAPEEDVDEDEDDADDDNFDPDAQIFDNDIVSPPAPVPTVVTEAAPPPVQG